MTQVNTTITPTAGHAIDSIQLHALAENALSMALYHLRHPGSAAINLHAATAKANRALTLLKHACSRTHQNATTVGA